MSQSQKAKLPDRAKRSEGPKQVEKPEQSEFCEQELLIIGSLPPVRSHAATLTHAVASIAAAHGIKVTCLIDALAPPPPCPMPYQIVRSHALPDVWAKYAHLPRLYVIGGKGDSLPILELFQKAPGPVIPAEHSLFPLLLPTLDKEAEGQQRFLELLEQKFGEKGKTIGQAHADHKRLAHGVGAFFPALDVLLGNASVFFALNPTMMRDLERARLNARPLNIMQQVNESPTQATQSPNRILLVGADDTIAEEIHKAFKGMTVIMSDRYHSEIFNHVDSADIVALLDGHDAATCPIFWHAAQELKALITCGQHWANDLPREAHQSCKLSATALFHAVIALKTSDRLVSLQRQALRKWLNGQSATAAQQQADFIKTTIQKPSEPLELGRYTLLDLDAADPTAGPEQTVSGPIALIGAVPAPLILKSQFPDLDTAHSPKFMTPEIAEALSEFMNEPRSRIVGEMGYEAPLITENSQNTPPHNKLKNWNQIEPDLLMAHSALSIGSRPIKGIRPAPPGKAIAVSWSFNLSALALNPKQTRGFNPNTGIYWKLNYLQDSLTLVFFTGSAGTLYLTAPRLSPLVITDLRETLVSTADADAQFPIGTNGIAHLKIALLPNSTMTSQSFHTIPPSQELTFKWSACKIDPKQDKPSPAEKLN